jgi:hypothetical protein
MNEGEGVGVTGWQGVRENDYPDTLTPRAQRANTLSPSERAASVDTGTVAVVAEVAGAAINIA